MAAIDQRPLKVQALHWVGMMAVCSPAALGVLALGNLTNGLPQGGEDLAGRLVFALIVALVGLTPILGVVAQRANSRFDFSRPEFPEFIRGLMLAPLWLTAFAVLIAVPILFFGGMAGVALWVARRL